MIGKIITGKSFRGCLQYCLNDKLADENKNEPVMKKRAEIIAYNLCYGNDQELIRQFNEVRQLNPRQSKPVLHITLSLAKGEHLPNQKLAEIAHECAQELGFNKNQFVAALHKDTKHPHMHIVANRIGYDGKTVSDGNNYQKMAQFCRKMELRYELQQVQSPNAFLPKELRKYNRMDERKLQLKNHIQQSLKGAKNFEEFKMNMQVLKYEVIKMRGIAFRDEQKVYTKGSEVGYSLATIEKVLMQKQIQKSTLKQQEILQQNYKEKIQPSHQEKNNKKTAHVINQNTIDALSKPRFESVENYNQFLVKKKKKRRKKRGQHY